MPNPTSTSSTYRDFISEDELNMHLDRLRKITYDWAREEPTMTKQLKFSKRNPPKIRFLYNKKTSQIRDIQKDAIHKIQKYKSILKDSANMSDELREELLFEIRKCRGRLKFNQIRTKAEFSYRGIKLLVPTNSHGFIDLDDFSKYKTEIIDILQKKREGRKKIQPSRKSVEGVMYTLYGGVHTRKNAIADLYREVAMRRVNSFRKPGANENHVGIEFEFITNHSREDVCQRLIDAKLSKYCRVMTDRSIRPTEDHPIGLELCVVTPESKFEAILERACEVLSDINANTNESCGLHVHIDARNRNKELLFANLVHCQNLFFEMSHPSRRRNTYCQPQSTSLWEAANDHHYQAINKGAYSKHQTIEVRTHEGTVNFLDVKNWIRFLIKIADYTEELKAISKPRHAIRHLKLNADLKDYVQNKWRKYAK